MYHKTRLVFSYKKAKPIIPELAYIFNSESILYSIRLHKSTLTLNTKYFTMK